MFISLIVLLLLTTISYVIGTHVPLLGASITALLLGIGVAHSPLRTQLHIPFFKKASSTLLKYGIVLLGLTLSLRTLTQVGTQSLFLIVPLIALSFAISLLVGKWLGLPVNTRLLIGVGTAICGGSAIAAASPIIEAEEDDIAFAMTTIFTFNLIGLFVFPLLATWLGYNDTQFGTFVGVAVHDTSSVVAASFAFSQQAGEVATVVKLVRTLMIIPVCLLLIAYRLKKISISTATHVNTWHKVKQTIPLFIVWFIIAVIIASFVPLPSDVLSFTKKLSRFLMTMALCSVGMTMNFHQLKHSGTKALLLGAVTWTSIIIASILAIH